MRILRPTSPAYSPAAYNVVAGELLNLEIGYECFIDGKEVIDITKIPAGTPRYPIIESNGKKYHIRAVKGTCYINFTTGITPSEFGEQLKAARVRLLNGRPVPLEYRAIENGAMSKLMVKPRTTPFQVNIETIDRIQFSRVILYKFNLTIETMQNTVYYDPDGLVKFNHNETTHRLQNKYFHGHDYRVKVPEVTICNFTDNPLVFELTGTRFYTTNQGYIVSTFNSKVRIVDAGDIRLLGTKCPNEDTVYYGKCSKCYCDLYDDVYATVGYDGPKDKFTPICLACAHTLPDGTIDSKASEIVTFKAETTISDIIARVETSQPILADVYREILKSLRPVSIRGVQCVLAGDKYVMVTDRHTYYFTNIWTHPILKDRKVVATRIM